MDLPTGPTRGVFSKKLASSKPTGQPLNAAMQYAALPQCCIAARLHGLVSFRPML